MSVTDITGGLMLLAGWRTRSVVLLLGSYRIIAVASFELNPADTTDEIVRAAELAVRGRWNVNREVGARKEAVAPL